MTIRVFLALIALQLSACDRPSDDDCRGVTRIDACIAQPKCVVTSEELQTANEWREKCRALHRTAQP